MIFKILSLILLILLVRAAFSVFGLVNQIRRPADQMKDQINNSYGPTQQNRQPNGSTYGKQAPHRQQQKIIPDEEGEYVDYEDVSH